MRFRIEICVLLLFTMMSGCALFSSGTKDSLTDKKDDDQTREAFKPTAAPVKRIVRLKSSVIPQPAAESRVRKAVWNQMSENCLIRPQTRRRLNQTGFRVGVSQPPYPWALDSLLSSSKEYQQRGSSRSSSQGSLFFSASGHAGTPVVIPEGSDSLVEIRRGTASEIPDDVTIPGLTGLEPYDEIRCVLRVRTLTSDDNGALLQFLPELQFGSQAMRLTVRDGREQLPVRQKIVPLFDQQFELKLHANDVIVLGYNRDEQWTTGQFFFRSDRLNGSQEHLVVLQVSDVETVEGRPSVQVDYIKC